VSVGDDLSAGSIKIRNIIFVDLVPWPNEMRTLAKLSFVSQPRFMLTGST
jgi:hypothetical protein